MDILSPNSHILTLTLPHLTLPYHTVSYLISQSLEGSNDQEGPESDKALYCCCLGLSVALHVGTLACILGLLWIHYGRRDHYLQLGVYDVLMGLCGAFGILGE